MVPVPLELVNTFRAAGSSLVHKFCAALMLPGRMAFTVIVNVCGVPLQTPKDGVTVIVAVTFELELFTGLKAAIFPVPEPANPIDVVLFDQLIVTPEVGEVTNEIAD
jgi:hypothetical protein